MRRRLNPPSPGSSVVGSHLAINMSDMFNSPNPRDHSTASASGDASMSVMIGQSEQPHSTSSDHSDVINMDSSTTGSSISSATSPIHGATANTRNTDDSVISSNPPEPGHPTSATSYVIENANTATEQRSSTTGHIPSNANGSASSESVLCPSSSEVTVHPTSSLSQNQHSDHIENS